MASGRSFRELRGRLNLSEPVIISNWKGLVVARSMARKIDQVRSDERSAVNTTFTQLAQRWRHALTQAQRDAWEQYANLMGSAYDRDTGDVAGTGHNLIRARKKLMSGINAYIAANQLASTAGLAIPRDDAPIGDPAPVPASGVAIAPGGGGVIVTWTDPAVIAPITDAVVRIHMQAQANRKWHTQIVSLFTVPTPGTATITQLRSGGGFGSPVVDLALVRGFIRAQLDVVAVTSATRGARVSPPSEVAQTVLV